MNTLVEIAHKTYALLADGAARFAPRVLLAVAILFVGYLFARMLRKLTARLMQRLAQLVGEKTEVRHTGIEKSSALVSRVAFIFVMMIAVFVATEVAGLPIVSTWLAKVASQLPRFLAALLIMLAGWVLARTARDVLSTWGALAVSAHKELVGRVAEGTIILISWHVGFSLISIDISFLLNIIMVLIAGGVLTVAVAFGLGASGLVGNILSSYYIQKNYRAGQYVKVDSVEGQILGISPTTVTIETSEGIVSFPARTFGDSISTRLEKK